MTALGDGVRVAKTHPRVEAYGTTDELNCLLGLLATVLKGAHRSLVIGCQNDLFDLGADLCIPHSEKPYAKKALRITPVQVVRLERAIDDINGRLAPLTSFVLPGGSAAAAWCHLARTVCRRAERRVAALAANERINPEVLRYLNRLSDLLFVLGRALNANGRRDVPWVPGRNTAAR